MKIENNSISPLSPKKTESTQRADKKKLDGEVNSVQVKRDNAVVSVSGNARTLAKARASLDHSTEIESEKVLQIRQQIESGSYSVQTEEIARRLMAGVFSDRT
jgi:flagellar biosynthesis anti-sigma factor FlgM